MNREERRKKILIVEDDSYVYELLQYILTQSREYEVIIAEDALRAWEYIKREGPDLIFLDYMLPKGDGISICKELKTNEATKNIPVIVMSAVDRTRIMREKQCGAACFISKPFEPSEVLDKVERLLKYEKESEIKNRLEDADEEVRRTVVEEIGDKRDESKIEDLLHLMKDERNLGVLESLSNTLVTIGSERVIKGLIPFLTHDEAMLRNLACEILVNIGEESTLLLYDLLREKDHNVRKYIVDVLGEIGSDKSVPHLVGMLKDENVNVACAVAESLGKIGDKSAVEYLIEAVKNGDPTLSYYAILALGKIGDERAVDYLISVLYISKEDTVRHSVIEALGQIGDRRAVKHLVPMLDDDLELGKAALKSIGRIDIRVLDKTFRDTDNPRYFDLMTSALRDENKELKKYALIAMGSSIPLMKAQDLLNLLATDDDLVPFIIQDLIKMGRGDIDLILPILERDEEKVREIIAIVLGDVQKSDDKIVDALIKIAEDSSPVVRKAAVRALGKLESNKLLEPLLKAINDEDNMVRASAVDALGWMRAKEAVPVLIKQLGDNYRDMVESTINALIQIDGDDVQDRLFEAIGNSEPHVKERIVQVLGMMSRDEKNEQILLDMLKSDSWNIRKAALTALGREINDKVINAIQERLKDENVSVRICAIRLLGRINDEKIKNLLKPYAKDKDTWIRYEVLKVLGRFRDDWIFSELMDGLRSGEGIVQIGACEGLGMQGKQEAVEELKGLLRSDDRELKEAAEEAIRRLAA